MRRLYESRKRVLVTGGAGFIGSHLIDRLLSMGHEVICVDNFFTGSKSNIEHLKNNWMFEFVRHDVSNPIYFEADEIYNLACPASPVHYQHDPIQTTKTSVMGAINVLELAARLKCKVLQASTSEVYGDPLIHPQVEGYWGNVNPIGPRSCYDEGKRVAETLFFDYHRKHGVDIKVVRIFNTYGPRMHPSDGRVVSNFIVQALQQQPITVFGTGEQTRSFCFIDDLVDGLLRMMDTGPEVTGPINLGNPDEFSIGELAVKVTEKTGSKSQVIYSPLPQDDPRQRKPDIQLAVEKLGWLPSIPLDLGLDRTIEHFMGKVAVRRIGKTPKAMGRRT